MRMLVLLAALRAFASDGSAAIAPAEAQADAVTVAGLDGSQHDASSRLTAALRRGVLERGFAEGADASLSDLRLAGGCTETGPECLARGAGIVGTRRIVFGTLHATEDGFALNLSLLDVAAVELAVQVVVPLAAADLSAEQIDKTARRIVGMLFPDGGTPMSEVETEPADDRVGLPSDGPTTEPRAESEPKWIWGPYNPRPIGKRVFFGVSVGIASIGIVGVIASAVGRRVASNNTTKAAEDSLDDGIGDGAGPGLVNDVQPGSRESMCRVATSVPDATMPNAVLNKSVAQTCASFDTSTRYLIGMAVFGGVGVLATAVSTTLMFGRRSEAKRRSTLEISPTLAGVSLRGRF